MQQVYDDRSVGDLFSDLFQDTRLLITQEMQLARTEMSQKASMASRGATWMAVGGFVAYAGFLALLAALIIGLEAFIPAWLSALIVGVVVALIGYVLLRRGMSMVQPEKLKPQQTMDSLKETKQWAQDQVR